MKRPLPTYLSTIKKHSIVLPKGQLFIDAAFIIVALYLGLFLRLGWEELPEHLSTFNKFVPVFFSIKMICFLGMGVYGPLWRYVSVFDAYTLSKAIALSSILSATFSFVMLDWWGHIPRSVFFIDCIVCLVFLMGVRLFRRMLFEAKANAKTFTHAKEKVLIYGAGFNGRMLAQRFQMDSFLNSEVVGFIDDDPVMWGRRVSNVKILGGVNDLDCIIKNIRIDQIIIAISNATGDVVKKVLKATRYYNITPQIVSDFSSGSSKKPPTLFREVVLGDLVNRKVTHGNIDSLRDLLEFQTILITGAGGSIGSEIARQVKCHNPSKLLLLDHSEYALYQIDMELRLDQGTTENSVTPILADIKDRKTLANLFQNHKPSVVFHAAAYKHVHLVEANPFSAILNNVHGTKNLLDLARQFGVKRFVNISTDKAVNSVGVMGATKRLCELLASSFGHDEPCHFCSVRFGNVLGSSGSFVSLLEKQIKDGGPLTITHKDMKRYYMLIPEAIHLVLLSAVISKPGDINILNMGEQIKIVDIAKNLITLMGCKESEIPIIFTGVRPGEKMSEDLYCKGNELKTSHPDILTLPKDDSYASSARSLMDNTQKIIQYASEGNRDALTILFGAVNREFKGHEQEATFQ